MKPVRVRNQKYLGHIRGMSCLSCGAPGEAHHIQFAQPRAMGLKTGDQYAVPVCHKCHMDLHNSPMPERTWWSLKGIDPIVWAHLEFEKWSREDGK